MARDPDKGMKDLINEPIIGSPEGPLPLLDLIGTGNKQGLIYSARCWSTQVRFK